MDKKVKKIILDVRKRGDRALIFYAKKFDGVTLSPKGLRIKGPEVKAAYSRVSDEFLGALRLAIKNITFFHEKQKPDEWFETVENDAVLGLRSLPIERIGIYVPGGRAPYPSSVLMSAIPAKVAGVSEIAMVCPSDDPHILVAAAEVGITEMYRIGGAQAIAALAYGTETVKKVDKIVGPGNIYVTLAKKMVYGDVGIDKLAGPSEILIIADSDADPRYIAADLLSQAEHDPLAKCILLTTAKDIAVKVKQELNRQTKGKQTFKAFFRIKVVKDLSQAAEISNQIAPEHLELMVDSPQNLLSKIKNAGAVFLGPESPVVVGDYVAGPNHVLPTSGTARFSSALGVYDFIKQQTVIGYTKEALKKVLPYIQTLAEVEKLDAHRRSAEIRFK